MGSTVEGPLPVHRQQQFAPRRQEVTVAAQPAHVAAVKADYQCLGQLGRRGGKTLDPPEQERRADRLTLAEGVDLDESYVQRQLDRRIVYLRQRGLGLGQIVEEGLEQLTSGRVGHHLGVRILREDFLDLWRWLEER